MILAVPSQDAHAAKKAYIPNKWVKTYSGISYKKMKKIFVNRSYTPLFILIKNKKGKVTKMVKLFVS